MIEGNSSVDVRESAAVDVAEFFSSEPSRLSAHAESIRGSTILQIAGEIRQMLESGEKVLNLTVGDFRPSEFPVPPELTTAIVEAHRRGETNYPPVEGVRELREAVRDLVRDDLGLAYPLEGVLIAGGARPLIYATFCAVVDPGDLVIYPVPSWNNHHYARLARANGKAISVSAEKNFHLDREDLAPHMPEVRLICLNSPLNPTGTCIGEEALRGICEAICEENERRSSAGERPVFLLYDQVYNTLTFGNARHETPVGLMPEIAPYALMVDAVSKGMSGTGLRVGWGVGPPPIIKKMSAMAGHFGAWAPRPEQVGTAEFLRNRDALNSHRLRMREKLTARLSLLDQGLREMANAGLPVQHIAPQGAIYLSVRFDLTGKTVAGRTIQTNDDLRAVLLQEAGFAIVPFEAFGYEGESGWVRISVGAVSLEEIREGLRRVRALLAGSV